MVPINQPINKLGVRIGYPPTGRTETHAYTSRLLSGQQVPTTGNKQDGRAAVRRENIEHKVVLLEVRTVININSTIVAGRLAIVP